MGNGFKHLINSPFMCYSPHLGLLVVGSSGHVLVSNAMYHPTLASKDMFVKPFLNLFFLRWDLTYCLLVLVF